MSAFVVSKEHVAAIVKWFDEQAPRYVRGGDFVPVHAANLLMAENVKSVNHRYEESFAPDEPEPILALDVWNAPRLSAVECIKACHCLAYQSCEHPAWEKSAAKKLLDRIESAAVHSLPGYDAAAWEISTRVQS